MTPPDQPGANSDYGTLLRLLAERHSCRAFSERPVPEGVIRQMLEAGQRAASWNNVQPWDVIVMSGEGTERFRAALYEVASTQPEDSDIPLPEEYVGRYKLRRRESGYALYESIGIERFDMDARRHQALENFRFFGAPHTAIIHSDAKLGPYGWVDCGAYIGTLLLAAQALGLAAVPQAAIALHSSFVHEYFGIGADRTIVAAVSFGYENEHPANRFRTTRATLDDVVTWVDR